MAVSSDRVQFSALGSGMNIQRSVFVTETKRYNIRPIIRGQTQPEDFRLVQNLLDLSRIQNLFFLPAHFDYCFLLKFIVKFRIPDSVSLLQCNKIYGRKYKKSFMQKLLIEPIGWMTPARFGTHFTEANDEKTDDCSFTGFGRFRNG